MTDILKFGVHTRQIAAGSPSPAAASPWKLAARSLAAARGTFCASMRGDMTELTQSRLKELLHYDPETGVFVWRIPRGSAKTGDVAGCPHPEGYRKIMIDRKIYLAHRLAWLYVHGAWPKDEIDHRNGVRADNRFTNLREATRAENGQNLKIRADNTSGFIGVSWYKPARKWQAHINLAGRNKNLGCFDTPEAAHAAYLAAKAEHHTFQPTIRQAGVTE